MLIENAYAQGAAATGGIAEQLTGMLPLVLMFVVLYFLMIRPQMKRQKEMKAMIEALQKGDEVVTAGGVAGRISKLQDAWITIEIADGVEIVVQRSAVTTALPKGTLKSL
jgi:preprotein translocase subunit YajC